MADGAAEQVIGNLDGLEEWSRVEKFDVNVRFPRGFVVFEGPSLAERRGWLENYNERKILAVNPEQEVSVGATYTDRHPVEGLGSTRLLREYRLIAVSEVAQSGVSPRKDSFSDDLWTKAMRFVTEPGPAVVYTNGFSDRLIESYGEWSSGFQPQNGWGRLRSYTPDIPEDEDRFLTREARWNHNDGEVEVSQYTRPINSYGHATAVDPKRRIMQ